MFAAKGQVEDIYFPVVNDGELNHRGDPSAAVRSEA